MGKTVNVRKKDDTKRAFSYLIKFFVPNVRYEPNLYIFLNAGNVCSFELYLGYNYAAFGFSLLDLNNYIHWDKCMHTGTFDLWSWAEPICERRRNFKRMPANALFRAAAGSRVARRLLGAQ